MNDYDDWRSAVARVTDTRDGFSSCWLASDEGHLITVGHLFGEDDVSYDIKEDTGVDWANGLMVQFPGSSPAPAKLLRARVDRSRYLDYAVLKIDTQAIPHDVRPIPISTSISDVHSIKMYGFGADKPDTRMAAVGRLEGWSEGLSGESWLKVTCEDAVQQGYSGAAVYSDMVQGAVALQIEASNKGVDGNLSKGVSNVRTVVAVAMARILQDWPVLEKIVSRSTGHMSRVFSNGFVLSHSHGIVGRQDQVDDILKELDKRKAVLVYGEGGIGKTEVCREVIKQSQRDVLVSISLAEVNSYNVFLSQLLIALHIKIEGDEVALKAALINRLAELPQNRLMVYFDNFEDLLAHDICPDDRARSVQLIREIKDRTRGMLLISSRRRLNNKGLITDYSLDVLEPEYATELFCRVWSEGNPDVLNARTVASIQTFVKDELCCFPLTIVLTASQHHRSFERLRSRWQERKGEIRLEYPDNPRHQSLVQALAMSYEEIEDSSVCRRLWELFTLFPSSVSQETLIAVLSEPNGSYSAFDVEEALDSLGSLSIVRWEVAGVDIAATDTECDMLLPLRQILELLPQSADKKALLRNDRDDVIKLLLTYYASYLADDRVLLRSEDKQSQYILNNMDNILYYMSVLVVESPISYTPVLEYFNDRIYNYYAASPYNARDTLTRIINIDGISKSFSASLHKELGDLAMRTADLDGAAALYVEAEGLYRRVGDDLGLANVLQSRGDLMQEKRDYSNAIDTYTKALELYMVVNYLTGTGYTLSELIYCYASKFKDSEEEKDFISVLALADDAKKVIDILPYEAVKEYMLRKILVALNQIGAL